MWTWPIKNRLLKGLNDRLRTGDVGAAQARSFRALLGVVCPWCKGDLISHQVSFLSAISGTSDDAKRKHFIEALRAEDFASCRDLAELGIETDSVDVFVLRCPDKGGGWVARKVPTDSLERAEIVETSGISREGWARLESPKLAGSLEWRQVG